MGKRVLVKIIITFFMIITIFTTLGCGGGGGGGGSTAAFSESTTFAWDPPVNNNDGSPLADLAGYKIYYGPSSDNYTHSIDVGNTTSASVTVSSSGTWCFATTAYNISGNESNYSNEVCTVI